MTKRLQGPPRKDTQIGVRLTREERQALERVASDRKMHVSEFVRHLIRREVFGVQVLA